MILWRWAIWLQKHNLIPRNGVEDDKTVSLPIRVKGLRSEDRAFGLLARWDEYLVFELEHCAAYQDALLKQKDSVVRGYSVICCRPITDHVLESDRFLFIGAIHREAALPKSSNNPVLPPRSWLTRIPSVTPNRQGSHGGGGSAERRTDAQPLLQSVHRIQTLPRILPYNRGQLATCEEGLARRRSGSATS